MPLMGWRRSTRLSTHLFFGQIRGLVSTVEIGPAAGCHTIPTDLPIFDQGGESSCVANATSRALAIVGNLTDPPSRNLIYWVSRKKSGLQDQDAGSYYVATCDALVAMGACGESVYPYVESQVNQQPGGDAFTYAADHREGSAGCWLWVDSLDDCERAIRTGHTVMVGGGVGMAFVAAQPGDVLSAPTDRVGGHATLLRGVRFVGGFRHFLLDNSWGTSWGEDGSIWVDELFVLSMDERIVLLSGLS